MIDIL
jgi:hypothetical protein